MENTSFEGIQISKRKPLREEVYDSLKRSILHGKLKARQRLIEEQLAHQIGISRTPVREAFHKLEKDDLVIRLPKGGFAVREFNKGDVEEIFGIRCALESYAAYLATHHITSDRISALEKKIDDLERALEDRDTNKVVQLNTEFHNLLYKACGSKKLADMINSYSDYFYRYRAAFPYNENNFKYTVDDRRTMLEAMKKKNPRLVEKLVRTHLEKTKELVIKAIDEGKMTP